MSRIGLKPITIPAGVSCNLDSNKITVSGKNGTLEQVIDRVIKVSINGDVITLSRVNELKETKAKHGLYRALIANMIKGVSEGFSKSLIVSGVGYKLNKQGKKLVLNLGLSHPVEFEEPEGVTIDVVSNEELKVSGANKELVGQTAAKLKELKPYEPYHLYGIRYSTDRAIKKEGKTAAKK